MNCSHNCNQGRACNCRTETQQIEDDDMPDFALALLMTTVVAILGLLAAGFVAGL
jgi:hypothetical protein